ncbi:MAG: hypothetical protein ACI8RZ_003678 [Myxococcota bacterium]|jgi:hypothetical protein
MLTLLALGCISSSTTMSGAIMDGPDSTAAVPDTAITIRSAGGSEWDAVTADATGSFEVTVPSHALFYLSAEAEGFRTTVFTGASDDAPVVVDDGTLWMRTEADIETLIADFGDCAAEESANGGGVIEGEIRLQVFESSEVNDFPIVTTAAVLAYTESGVPYTACYLDSEGNPSIDAVSTGETGRFAVFGVPSGLISLQIRYDYGGPEEQEDWYPLYMPDDGTVPMWPALVSMPTW